MAVVSGTPYDAKLGCGLLRAVGVTSQPYPLASSPDEQDALQYLDAGRLNSAFRDQLDVVAADGTSTVMLFCNSLSAVVDLSTVGWMSVVDVLSPLDIYRTAAADLDNVMVVAGNGQAIVGFERTLMSDRRNRRVVGVADPALVRMIESRDPERAFTDSSMPQTLRLAEQLGVDGIVFACTHFTAVLPFAEQACTVPIIDVGSRLVELTSARVGGAG
ncbi:aspartate/glutamate racemase family protein [Dactylosporangium sp. NPDC049525]|uniref:aspartate/glutamate racemase family protein n=1 Tax=Dactylosporangium sp. NPDC049525 TaxID=3154730 RepID=UPI0034211350